MTDSVQQQPYTTRVLQRFQRGTVVLYFFLSVSTCDLIFCIWNLYCVYSKFVSLNTKCFESFFIS